MVLPPHTRFSSQESSTLASPCKYSPLPSPATRNTFALWLSKLTQICAFNKATPCDKKCLRASSGDVASPLMPLASMMLFNCAVSAKVVGSLSKLILLLTALATSCDIEMPLVRSLSASKDCNKTSKFCNL